MTNDLTTRVAKLLWAKLPAPQMASDEIDEAARAVVALVLDEADGACVMVANACEHDQRHGGAMDCVDAIRALGVQS